MRRLRLTAADELGETMREHQAGFIDADVAAAVGGRLRELAEHDQLAAAAVSPPVRHRRRALARRADIERFARCRRKVERQALVAAAVMLVRADELIAGVADQHRARDELERAAAAAIAEAALAHVGDREACGATSVYGASCGPASQR